MLGEVETESLKLTGLLVYPHWQAPGSVEHPVSKTQVKEQLMALRVDL